MGVVAFIFVIEALSFANWSLMPMVAHKGGVGNHHWKLEKELKPFSLDKTCSHIVRAFKKICRTLFGKQHPLAHPNKGLTQCTILHYARDQTHFMKLTIAIFHVLHFFLVTCCHLYYLSLLLSFHFSFVSCHHHAFHHLFWLSSLPLLVIITIDVYFCCCSLSPLVLVIALLFVFVIMVYHHPYYSSLGNCKLRWLFLDTLGVHFDQIFIKKL